MTLLALGFVAAPAAPARAATIVVIPGADWLQGQGVDVNDDRAYSTATNPWQCVELPQMRLYPKFGWPKVFAAGNSGAAYIPEGSPGLERHNPGTGYVPAPGDLMIENPTPTNAYGHVAVVDRVEGNNIIAVEQNRAGWHTYTYNDSNYAGGYGSVKAVMHAPQNHFQNPSTGPVDSDGDGVLDDADKCPAIAGPAANSGCPYVDPRTFLATKYGPAECGRAGETKYQTLVCNLWKKGKWVSVSSPQGDWGYADTRGWIANRDGTVSHCAAVGTGNQLRCDTFTGTKWTTRTSPATDLGYKS